MRDEKRAGVLDSVRNTTVVFKEIMQAVVIMVLALFAIAAFADPPWAHKQLRRLGLELKEVDLPGLKLVVNESFKLAQDLAEAQQTLASAREALKAGGSTSDAARATLDEAIRRVSSAHAALIAQEDGTKKIQHTAGVQPELPASAWVTVGRLTAANQLQPAARIDATGTRIENGQVRQVALKQAAVVRNEENCDRTDIADVKPVSPEEMRRIVMLMKQGTYEVIETHACGSIGDGKWLSARIAVTADRVRLTAFEEAKR